jgi:hypothetical protein
MFYEYVDAKVAEEKEERRLARKKALAEWEAAIKSASWIQVLLIFFPSTL